MMDIYFESNYGKLCEVIERGHCEVFTHSSSLGIIRHMFIKREIPMSMNGQTYYDLITPYGYGGPLILECENGKENELALEFHERFSQYCRDNYVVSEFVRFHPIVDNARWFGSCYDVSFVRYTVGTDLERSEDPLMEFSKSCRSRIRKALREGVTYSVSYGGDIANYHRGSLIAPIDLRTGKITSPAQVKSGELYAEHPITGTRIVGFEVPYWREILEMIERAARVVPEIAYVGWDVAVTPSGPVILEGNHNPGYHTQQMPAHLVNGVGRRVLYERFL